MRLHTGAAWTPYGSRHWKLTGRKILVSQTSISWILNQLNYIPATKYTQNLTLTWRSYLTHDVACHVYSYQYSYMGAHVLLVPAGSPSHSRDVAVYIFFLHKPAKLAHSFLFWSCIYFCLYGPFNCISFNKFSQQLPTFSLCSSFCLIGSFNYTSLYENLLQPWYNPLWLTGLKTPTN